MELNTTNSLSLIDVKNKVAQRFGRKDWKQIRDEYEHGIGISKLMGIEELMDKVAEFYKNQQLLIED